jgi:presenilin-like A22 family membrane protease
MFTGVKCQAEMRSGEQRQLQTLQEQFRREFDCEFLGSANTLINPSKIKTMAFHNPIQSNAGLDMYEKPNDGGTYVVLLLTLQEEQIMTTLHLLYLMYLQFLIRLLQNIVTTKSNLYSFLILFTMYLSIQSSIYFD